MQTSDQLSAPSAARIEEPEIGLVAICNRFITRRILTAVFVLTALALVTCSR